MSNKVDKIQVKFILFYFIIETLNSSFGKSLKKFDIIQVKKGKNLEQLDKFPERSRSAGRLVKNNK